MDPRPPIPTDLTQAFEQALRRYQGWRSGDEEPTVTDRGRPVNIRILCGEVMNYSGSMPADVTQLLRKETPAGVDTKDFDKDNSYAGGARHLIKLIIYRGYDFRLTPERHKR